MSEKMLYRKVQLQICFPVLLLVISISTVDAKFLSLTYIFPTAHSSLKGAVTINEEKTCTK